jgi:hypothetical protein
VAFLVDLAQRARTGGTRVENPSSVAMIEASGSARGRDIANLTPWAAVAMVYSAGLAYECDIARSSGLAAAIQRGFRGMVWMQS